MPTRRKNGRIVPGSAPGTAPHGRPRTVAASKRSHTSAGDPATKYLAERFAVRLAMHDKDAKARRCAQERAERALAKLLAQPGGLERARAINVSLGKVDAAIRTASRAHVDLRPFAVDYAVLLLKLIDEHDVQSVAALELLGSAAANLKLASMLRDLAFRKGPGVLSASKTGKAADDEATTVSITLPAFADLLKLAAALGAAGRGDLATALDLERQAREERKRKPFDPAALLAGAPPPADEDDEDDPGEGVHSAPPAPSRTAVAEPALPSPPPGASARPAADMEPRAPSTAAAPAGAATRFTAGAPPPLPEHVAALAPGAIRRTAAPADLEQRIAKIRSNGGTS